MKYTRFLLFGFILIIISSCQTKDQLFFKISLAEWSFHRTIEEGKMTNLDFPRIAKTKYNIDAIEFVNQFFMNKAEDTVYLNKLKKECNKYHVKCVLIMIDDEGMLGDTNNIGREKAVFNHYKWIKAAKYLGCFAIRVNVEGEGDKDKVKEAAIESLKTLCDFAMNYKMNVIVENHMGYSFDAVWLSDIIRKVNKPNCGTLPDLGNFANYDKYKGVETLMPFAKDVSAKTYDFDQSGNETTIDYKKMLNIIHQAGYKGYLGIECETEKMSEDEAIKTTKALLIKEGSEIK